MFDPSRFEGNKGEVQPEAVPPSQERAVTIENQANYKGNWWLAQLDRLNNPTIRKQLVDLWETNEKFLEEHGIKECVGQGSELKDPATGQIIWLDEELGLPKYEQIYKNIPHMALSREEIEAQLEEAIDREASVTPIDFNETRSESYNWLLGYEKGQTETVDRKDEHHPSRRVSLIGLKEDETIPNQHATEVMSVVEAHEKGHTLRTLHGSEYLDNLFSNAFEFPRSERYLDTHRPAELIERMAQLKDYFGMKGDEKFTPQHLEYVREHYIEDTKLDNNMKEFFDAITPQKEFTFLKLINSIGV
jgi:hypothetical protein